MGSDTHILAIDAGNTRVKWGFFNGRRWSDTGAVPTLEAASLAQAWRSLPPSAFAFATNVAGAQVQGELERACFESGRGLTMLVSRPEQLGVSNGYRDFRQLGADRWAALVAAHHAHKGHKLVVNAGTALTIDALIADGHFLGGLIVPGPALMRRALDGATAGLRQTDGRFEAFPTGTPEAITSGAIQACIGAIDRMGRAMAAGQCAPQHLVLSGGAAGELAPHLPMPHVLNENLVLDGILLMARKV